MSKVGMEIKIDVTKIDKERIFVGQKGKYLTMTTFVDLDQQDQYGNNGMVTHKKEQGEEKAPILGNAKIFWRTSPSDLPPPEPHGQGSMKDMIDGEAFGDDDIPF